MKVNLGFWPRKHAKVYGRKAALRSDRYDLTFRELNERTDRLGHALRAAGVGRGERVATLLFNVCEQVEVVFAAAKIGAIVVPVNFRLPPPEVAGLLSDCRPRILIHDVDLAPVASAAVSALPFPVRRIVVPRDREDVPDSFETFLAAGASGDALDPTVGEQDPLFIMYTAGTTGAAKGVVLSHENVFWQTISSWALGIDPRAVGLVLLPLFHTGGMNASVLPLLHVGATVVLLKRFVPEEVLATVERHRVSGMVGVPLQYQMMADSPAFDKTDFSSVFALISGGGPLADSLTARYLARGLRFTQGYGLTEAAPGVTGMTPDEFATHPGSVGRRCLYVECEVVDESGRSCPPRVEGEIVVSGPNVMLGYWEKPEETAAVLRDGVLYTGDLGWFDEDGYLYLSGRKKDIIISGGENIHPGEVENAILDHPGVAEVAVVGMPDPKWTEVPVAAVVRKDPGLDADTLLAWLGTRLARYKLPRAIRFVDSLPRNAVGKVLKAAVKEGVALRSSVARRSESEPDAKSGGASRPESYPCHTAQGLGDPRDAAAGQRRPPEQERSDATPSEGTGEVTR